MWPFHGRIAGRRSRERRKLRCEWIRRVLVRGPAKSNGPWQRQLFLEPIEDRIVPAILPSPLETLAVAGQSDVGSVQGPVEAEAELKTLTYCQQWGDGEYLIEAHQATSRELQRYKSRLGTAEEGVDYNVLVDGYGTGLRAPTEQEWNQLGSELVIVDNISSLEADDENPTSIDWSTSQYFPPIGNQYTEGSCTAWAWVYYTKTFQEAREHGWDLSGCAWEGSGAGYPSSAYQDKIFSPDFVYHQINKGDNNGTSSTGTVRVINDIGAATWSTMPNDAADSTSWPSEAAWREAPIYRGDGGLQRLDISDSVEALKTLLVSGNLGVIGVEASDMYEMSTLDNFDNSEINHAQTIVGYDDDWSYTEEGETRYGAFKVANSWGGTWREDGYWWISYAALRDRVGTVSYMEDRIDYHPDTVAVFEIDHAVRDDTIVYVGTGLNRAPTNTMEFLSPGLSGDGNDPYPSNPIVLDISEFGVDPTTATAFYLEVHDGGSASTGTVQSFSVEYYSDYLNGVQLLSGVSLDTPLPMQENDVVCARAWLGSVAGIDLVGNALEVRPANLQSVDGTATVNIKIANVGDAPAGAFDVEFYLSDDDVIDPGTDIALQLDSGDPYYDVAEPQAYHVSTGVAAGDVFACSNPIALSVPCADPFGTDGVYYLGMVVDADNDISEADETNNSSRGETADRQQVTYITPAVLPFTEDWESGDFSSYWEVKPGAEGRIQVTSANEPFQGSYHVTLDDSGDDAISHNQLILHVDLAGRSGVTLSFANREWYDEDDPCDGVHISVDDGATWTQIISLTGENSQNTYVEQVFDLDTLGLVYSADTLIRFQQRDEKRIASDGMAFDDIQITSDVVGALTVSIEPSEITENGAAAVGTVTRSGDLSQAVTVALTSSDETQATVPSTVTIGANAATATFAVTPQDDSYADGTRQVTITARSGLYVQGSAVVDVLDDGDAPVPIVVNSLLDAAIDHTDDATNLTLRDALDLALTLPGDNAISFDASLFTGGAATISLTQGQLTYDLSPLTAQKRQEVGKVTVTGAGAHLLTIDAQSASRVFYFDSAGVELSDMTITGGMTGDEGGGIYAYASDGLATSVTVTDVTIEECSADHGGGIGARAYGDGSSNTLVVSNSVIRNNSATAELGLGGGIHAHAGVAGAASMTLTVEQSTISGNTAGHQGGGIHVSPASSGDAVVSLTIDQTTIAGNEAGQDGGGVSIGANPACSGTGALSINATLTDSTIENNTATSGGGGLFLTSWAGHTSVDVQLTRCTLEGNSAANGGGIHVYASQTDAQVTLTVDDSTIQNNTATTEYGHGGGIYVYALAAASSSLSVTDSTIQGNSATGEGGYGGGIYSYAISAAVSTIVLVDTDVEENLARVGGGIYAYSNGAGSTTTLSATRATFLDNLVEGDASYAGGIYVHAYQAGAETSVTLTDSTIQGNSAAGENGHGGGIYACAHTAGTLSITMANTSLQGNQGRLGGAICARSYYEGTATLSLTGATLANNTVDGANSYGGAIYAYAAYTGSETTVTITDSTVQNNVASGTAGRGGGIFTRADSAGTASLRVTDSTIQGNTASRYGGAIATYAYTESLTSVVLTNAQVLANATALDGGGIYSYSGDSATADLLITDSTLAENSASDDGGGIYAESPGSTTITLDRSTITRNSASSTSGDGGGIFASYNNASAAMAVVITNSTIQANSAHYRGGGIYTYAGAGAASITLTNSSIAGNTAGNNGGGIHAVGFEGEIDIVLNNAVVAKNTAGTSRDDLHQGNSLLRYLAHHSLIGDGEGISWEAGSTDSLIGTTAAPIDPLFVRNPDDGGDGWGDDTATTGVDESANDDEGDLRLLAGSPALDSGSNDLAKDADDDPLTTDRLGHARIVDVPGQGTSGTTDVDMGAYETPLIGVDVAETPISENSGTTSVTVTLGEPVPAGGAEVSLTSSNPAIASVATSPLTIAEGDQTVTFTLNIQDDNIDEMSQTVTLTASAAGYYDGADSLEIADDDPPPTVTLSISPASITEAGGTATITATLSALSDFAITVELGYSGAATGGVDYVASGTQIVIPAGSTDGTVTVSAQQDALDESNESVVVEITGVTNGTESGTQQVSTTIIDDDLLPTVTLSADQVVIAENGGTTTVTATLNVVSGRSITVNLGYSGTATGSGVDYTASGTQIVIPAGSTSGTVTVTAAQDALDESNESVVVEITGVVNGSESGTQQLTTTIIDDDPLPAVTLSIDETTIAESGGTATVTATLDATSGRSVTVNLGYSGATASGVDYTASGTQIVIPAGSTTGTVTVTAASDALDEDYETVVVDITGVENGTESDVQQVSATIIDDDPLPAVTLSIDSPTIAEAAGMATVTATLNVRSGRSVVVNLAYSGTATQGGIDYTASGAQIVIPAGSTSGTVTITAAPDALDEADETVVVDISSVGNAFESGVQQVSTTIVDDDPVPTVTLSIDQTKIAESGGIATVTATLDAVSGRSVTVSLGYSGAALGGGVDYTASGTQIVIPAGSASGSVTLSTVQDELIEGNEAIVVDITGVSNGSESGTQQVTTTILDSSSGPDQIGIHRGYRWCLDGDGSCTWNLPGDLYCTFGATGDEALIGDWNGDGIDEIGVHRGDWWYLDMDGNGGWNLPGDVYFQFGIVGDEPIVGDWNGDGIDEVGVHRGGWWYLDMDGNGRWNVPGDVYFYFGIAGDEPVIGDWNGDGTDEVGVHRGSMWYLDADGNHGWNVPGDQYLAFGIGSDEPVIGDWDGDGTDNVGVHRGSMWYLDADGNHRWNVPGDEYFAFGIAGDKPLVGYWSSDSGGGQGSCNSVGQALGSSDSTTGAVDGSELVTSPLGDASLSLIEGCIAADVGVYATVDVSDAAGNSVGLVARYSGQVGQSMCLGCLVNLDGDFYAEIWRCTGNTWTQLASSRVASGHGTLRLVVIGDALELFLNGQSVASVTDTTLDSTGAVGSLSRGGNLEALTLDRLTAPAIDGLFAKLWPAPYVEAESER